MALHQPLLDDELPGERNAVHVRPTRSHSFKVQSDAVASHKTIPFFYLALGWVVVVALICGSIIWAIEGQRVSYIDCLFIAFNGITATGLSPINFSTLSVTSKAMVSVSIQLGSSPLISLVPVIIRLVSLRTIIKRSGIRTFNLKRLDRVPHWLVEYKALVYLVRIVICYTLSVYLFYGSLLTIYLYTSEGAHAIMLAQGVTSPPAWSLFHIISAYQNAGFALQAESFGPFTNHPFLLACICMTCLHGNILFPVFIRWVVVVLSFRSRKASNRKVYFRYLLLNGRHVYSNLFCSQQTWVLLLSQLLMLFFQAFAMLGTCWSHDSYAKYSPGERLSIAFFEAVNTRHAGFTAIDLATVPGGALVVFLLFMFLAPVPFNVVLHGSMETPQATVDRVEQLRALTDAEQRAIDKPTSPPRSDTESSPALTTWTRGGSFLFAGRRRRGRGQQSSKKHTRAGNHHKQRSDNNNSNNIPGDETARDTLTDDNRSASRLLNINLAMRPELVARRRRRQRKRERRLRHKHYHDHEGEQEPTSHEGLDHHEARPRASWLARVAGRGLENKGESDRAGETGNQSEDSGNTHSTREEASRRQRQAKPFQLELESSTDIDHEHGEDGRDREEAREKLRQEYEYMTDTRTLLMILYRHEHVPYTARVMYRARAVRFHLAQLSRAFVSQTMIRDLIFLWAMWFILAWQEGPLDFDHYLQLGLLLELVSAYGNVGLSVGSFGAVPFASLAGDLGVLGKLVLMLVMVFGKTRSNPASLDSVLRIAREVDPATLVLSAGSQDRSDDSAGDLSGDTRAVEHNEESSPILEHEEDEDDSQHGGPAQPVSYRLQSLV